MWWNNNRAIDDAPYKQKSFTSDAVKQEVMLRVVKERALLLVFGQEDLRRCSPRTACLTQRRGTRACRNVLKLNI